MEIVNREARYNYFILEEYEAGISLLGSEIKSIRKGSVNLKDSFAIIKNNEIFLLNAYIAEYLEANQFNHDERRTRKLLMHRSEIKKLNEKIKLQGLSLIPLKMYFVKGKVKVLIALCRGKKNYDKRETIKERDLKKTNNI